MKTLLNEEIPKAGRAEIWNVALRLFRKFHGPGDAGSEHEFFAQSVAAQGGWLRLARFVQRINRQRNRYRQLFGKF